MKVLKTLKDIYIKFQMIPLLGSLLFLAYFLVKVIVCTFMGVCLVI